ncbi:MAG: hypothetical protein GY811_27755 [Myxococcales bacterium]|nr:hypothetical protein [Myxococcales bacterium]
MDHAEFESKVLELWVKSRIPLTQANLQYFAGVSRDKLTSWIDGMLDDGVLDIQIDDDDDLTYFVPGASRSTDGPSTCEAYERKRELVEEAKRRILAKRAGVPADATIRPKEDDKPIERRSRASDGDDDGDDDDDDDDGPGIAGMVGKAALLASTTALVTLDKPLSMLDKPRGEGEKSLLGSAAISLLGPVGWLYAGSFREAVPATLGFAAAYYILPSFLLAPFALVGALASSAIGLGYAWQYNRKKGRTPLFLRGKNDKKKNE